MTNDEISYYEGFVRHQVFNGKNKTIVDAIDGYPAKQAIMDNAIIAIDTGVKVESESGTTDTKTVFAKKKGMAVMISDFCEGGVILANAAGETALANSINKSMTYFLGANKKNAVTRAQAIRKLFFDNATVLTNVKAADLLIIDNAITAYDSIKDLPITQIKEVKSHGTEPIAIAVAAGWKASQDQYGLFHSMYGVLDPDMTEELRLLHLPIFTGYRKTPLTVTIVDDITGEAINGSSMSKPVKKGKEIKTFNSKEGVVPFDTHKSGDTEYTVMAPNYVTTIHTVKVVLHENNVVEIRMKKS